MSLVLTNFLQVAFYSHNISYELCICKIWPLHQVLAYPALFWWYTICTKKQLGRKA